MTHANAVGDRCTAHPLKIQDLRQGKNDGCIAAYGQEDAAFPTVAHARFRLVQRKQQPAPVDRFCEKVHMIRIENIDGV